MKSIANQYRDLKEGRMSQSNFMRNLRMMVPQYITNVTSFNDAVRILKNKAILTENLDPKQDEEDEIEDMIAKAAEEESGKYTKFQDFEGGLGENMTDPDSEEFTLAVEDYLNSGKWGLTPEQEKEALIYLEDNYYDLQGDFANNYDVDGGAYAAAEYVVSVVKSKEDLNEAKKKKEAKVELHPNQIHPQELRMGIKVELEHTDDLDKAKKIALDHLAENPFYYTALKLSGIESPSAPKVKASKEAPKKAKKKDATELVDKVNAMQKVKMPKDKINEDYESWLSQKKGEEARAKRVMQATNAEGVKFSVNDIVKTPDGKEIKITGFTTGKDGKMKAMYSAGMFADVYNLDDLEKKPSFRPGVDLGASFDKFKASLEEVVREVVAEYYDGRDNLDAENEY